jgi:hypothetical protein
MRVGGAGDLDVRVLSGTPGAGASGPRWAAARCP